MLGSQITAALILLNAMFNKAHSECVFKASQGNKVGTIKLLPKTYTVSFSVKATALTKGRFLNVFHFTTGGNMGKMGMRTPAVWFWNDELHIASGVNGNPNFWRNTPKLALNQWSDVTIINSKNDSKYFYSVYFNGMLLVEAENPTTSEYKDVQVWVSDPWHQKFAGSLCNLMVTVPNGVESISLCPMTLFSINNNIETEQNRTISTIPYLSKVYIVSFSVKPNAFVMGRYTSVLHFTTGGNFGAMGMRIPAVWFWNDKLHIANGVNGHPNYWINTPKLAKDQWSDVIIINTKVGESFIYEILLNGKLVHRTTNTTPREYKNVRVYATDPWYPKFQGELQNLLVTTPGSFGCK